MKTLELNSINRFYFGYEDIVRALKIRPASSARVSASRYVMSYRRALAVTSNAPAEGGLSERRFQGPSSNTSALRRAFSISCLVNIKHSLPYPVSEISSNSPRASSPAWPGTPCRDSARRGARRARCTRPGSLHPRR